MAKSAKNVPTFMAKISLSVLDKKRPILKPPLRIECSQSTPLVSKKQVVFRR